MFPHFVNLFNASWQSFRNSLGTTTLGFVAPLVVSILSIVVTLYFVLRQQGREAMLKRWREDAWIALRVTFIVTVLVYGPIWFWKGLVETVYNDHARATESNNRYSAENDRLKKDIEDRKQNIRIKEPAYEHIQYLYAGYRDYRKAIGAKSSCQINFTAPADSGTSAPIVRQFIDAASYAAECGAVGPMDSSSNPQVEIEATTGMEYQTVILHSPKGNKAGEAFFNMMSPFVRMKRSYKMPANDLHSTMWLQFGKDVNWLR